MIIFVCFISILIIFQELFFDNLSGSLFVISIDNVSLKLRVCAQKNNIFDKLSIQFSNCYCWIFILITESYIRKFFVAREWERMKFASPKKKFWWWEEKKNTGFEAFSSVLIITRIKTYFCGISTKLDSLLLIFLASTHSHLII